MKIKKVDIPIFFGYFRIVIAKDLSMAYKKIVNDGHEVSDYDAFVYNDKTKKGICRHTVFLHPKCGHAIIAHEVVHLVNALFINSDIKLDPRNDETQAYLTGWFIRQIYKVIEK
jgi:hypothetical protein